MIVYFLAIGIIILCLLIIISIIIKKLPQLAGINIQSIATERDTEVKNRIIADRLVRKLLGLKKLLAEVLKPLQEQTRESFRRLYRRVAELEKISAQQANPLKTIDMKQAVKDKLAAAAELINQDKMNEAEGLFIEVIKLDTKNVDAYEGLVQVYLANRDYKKARETCRFNIKLFAKENKKIPQSEKKHRLAKMYADLGWIYQLERKNTYALANFQKAVDCEPSNPRFLDLLLKISILLKNKDLAWRAYNGLKEADPENKKLPELKEEITTLPDLAPPAESVS